MLARDRCPRRSSYRVLAVSDRVEPRIYGPHIARLANKIDLIVSCGDLPYYYLDYIVSSLDCAFVYVHGNHDRPEHRSNHSVAHEPVGGRNLHGRAECVDGLLMLGLEGSHRYNTNARYQYSQTQMWNLALTLVPRLLLNRLLYGRYLDVLIAHSPPFGIHDAADRPHIGFQAFLPLLRWFRPKYMLHGHQHVYTHRELTRTRYAQTDIINIYPVRVLSLDFAAETS